MLKVKTLLAVVCLVYFIQLYSSISIVYNIKIAETTKRQAFDKNGEHPSTLALTPFNQFRNKYSGARHNYGGNMVSYIYSPETYYARVDWAFAQVNADHGTFVKTQTDDLLFSAGYSFAPNERSKCTISGFFGVPTHNDHSIIEPQFGFAQVGLGGQFDGSFIFSEHTKDYSLRVAARAIHFFKRNVQIDSKSYHFSLGTLVDLYVALHIKFGNSHCDIGYNPTLLCGGSITPDLVDAVKQSEFKRNSFFGVYKYKFNIKMHPSALAIAASYGFDFEPREFGNKRIITVWGLWSFSF